MRPLIGITSEVLLEERMGRPWNASRLLISYSSGLVAAGAAPVILPPASHLTAHETMARLDGLILSGGRDDVPPEVFGEERHPTVKPIPMARWDSEKLWLATALALQKPVLGICLGMQVMNVVAGGKMIQDIPDQRPGSQTHGAPSGMHQHEIAIEPGTVLAGLASAERPTIISSHHQAVSEIPSGYRVSAVSDDGVIEAIESVTHEFLVGVQWHPERSPQQPDWLLQGFTRFCASRKSPEGIPSSGAPVSGIAG